MADILIDLNSKVVSPFQKIWIVHHGRNRNFMGTFKEEGVVFLEYPDLQLSERVLANDAALRQRIRYSRSVRANRGPGGLRLADYSSATGNDVAIALRTIKHLTLRIQAGDLIIVPGRGGAGGVLFGEAAGSFFPVQSIRAPGMEFSDTPVRRVNWLHEIAKREIPGNLVSYFEKPPAIAEVKRTAVTDRFFDYAYDAYSTDAVAWLSIDAPRYDGRDFMSVVAPLQLIAFAVALYRALESGADLTGKSYLQIIEDHYDGTALTEAQLSFASPGGYGMKDHDDRLAKFINAIVAMTLVGTLAACGAGTNADVQNSKAPNDPSTAQLSQMVNQAAQSADQGALQEADRQGEKAKAKLALNTPATVK